MSKSPLTYVLSSQFFSAMADNMLLFAAIAMLKVQHYPDWAPPLLQESFVAAYVLLAMFAGPLADGYSKGSVMLRANLLKLVGASLLVIGFNPFLAYGLVGIGAVVYSSAKYGILSELVGQKDLVKANGKMEGATIAAILLGTVLGGLLSDYSVTLALGVSTASYLAAIALNTKIPRLPVKTPLKSLNPVPMARTFWAALVYLLKDRQSRTSILGTAAFWGAGTSLRMLLVAWVPFALLSQSNTLPALLNAAVAVGVVIGAGLAAKFVPLTQWRRALPAGLVIGAAVLALSLQENLVLTGALLLAMGVAGGFYVVPLNAILQERGNESVGAGNAVAVQNLFENLFMLVMLGGYMLLTKAGFNPASSAALIGGGLLALQTAIWLSAKGRPVEVAAGELALPLKDSN
jgi:LPLT family lysophospholipid transporter-like MFS transporter